jgi:hypothetical protein
MADIIRQKVFEPLAEVFDVLFSIPLKPLGKSPPRKICRNEDSYIEVRVDVSNGKRFPVYLFLPEGLALRVAGDFMDMDSCSWVDENIMGGVKEGVCMAIGGFLGRMDPEARCTMGVAVAKRVEAFSLERLSGATDICGYESDFGYLWMDLGDIEAGCLMGGI